MELEWLDQVSALISYVEFSGSSPTGGAVEMGIQGMKGDQARH